jgi:predicted  nucleic acid-binding Zn-ribbon protein
MTTRNLLSTTLKAAEPILQEYVRQLKAEITILNKQIANLEIEKNKYREQNITYKKRISTLQKAIDKTKSNEGGDIILQVVPASRTKNRK